MLSSKNERVSTLTVSPVTKIMRLASCGRFSLIQLNRSLAAHLRHFEIAYDEIVFADCIFCMAARPSLAVSTCSGRVWKYLNKEIENVFLVVDDQNAFAAHELFELQRLRHQLRRRPGFILQMRDDGQLYDKSGSFSQLASGVDVPAMLLDHPVG